MVKTLQELSAREVHFYRREDGVMMTNAGDQLKLVPKHLRRFIREIHEINRGWLRSHTIFSYINLGEVITQQVAVKANNIFRTLVGDKIYRGKTKAYIIYHCIIQVLRRELSIYPSDNHKVIYDPELMEQFGLTRSDVCRGKNKVNNLLKGKPMSNTWLITHR